MSEISANSPIYGLIKIPTVGINRDSTNINGTKCLIDKERSSRV